MIRRANRRSGNHFLGENRVKGSLTRLTRLAAWTKSLRGIPERVFFEMMPQLIL